MVREAGETDRAATQVLPDLDAAGAEAQADRPKPRRRRRWWLRILIVVVVLGVLAGAAEIVLRAVIPNVVSDQVREQLKLSEDHPVDVELGGSTVLSALTGRVGPIEVEVPDAPLFEGIVATLAVEAQSLPFDPTKGEIEGARAGVLIPAESVGTVVKLATQGMADTGQVGNGVIAVGRTMNLFGAEVTLSVTLQITAQDGDLWIEPVKIDAAGFDLTAEQIRTVTGDALDGMLTAHEVCVRDRLPVGVTLTDVRLSSTGSVTIAADLSPTILSDPKQQAFGSCDS